MWIALFGVAVLCLTAYYVIAQKQLNEYRSKLETLEKQCDELQSEKSKLQTSLAKVEEKTSCRIKS